MNCHHFGYNLSRGRRHNIGHSQGYTLVELTTVLAVTAILMAATVPLGAVWTQKAKLADATGELTHGIGKAIGVSMRNQHALSSTQTITAVCLSETNQLTVLEADATTMPDCEEGDGDTIWTASLPVKVEITSAGTDVTCLCFNSTGLLTDSDNCGGCFTGTTVEVAVGSNSYSLYVH